MPTDTIHDQVGEELDLEIAGLQSQIESTKREVKIQATTLISSDSTRHILQSYYQERGILALPQEPNPIRDKVMSRSKAQEAHDQHCLYRSCATITTFKVQDPDPNAVDNGHVLGMRFEVMSKARFLRPYYVMLNRPYTNSRHLRVHRHTIPPCIPLAGLAARYLPGPKASDHEGNTGQDTSRFARMLRREIVRYHNRTAVILDLREGAGLVGKDVEDDDGTIHDISAADPEARQVKIEWADGKTGRLVMSEDGQVQKLVIFREDGRDRETMRELLGDSRRVEDVVKRLGVI